MAGSFQVRLKEISFWMFGAPLATLALPILIGIRFLERRQWPHTVDQAVDKLVTGLSPKDIRLIQSESDEVDWFSFGMGVRNRFGLWEGNSQLLESCGVTDDLVPADAASGVIIAAMKRRLDER